MTEEETFEKGKIRLPDVRRAIDLVPACEIRVNDVALGSLIQCGYQLACSGFRHFLILSVADGTEFLDQSLDFGANRTIAFRALDRLPNVFLS